MLRFSDISIMCLRVSDDIDAVIWVKNATTILTLFLALSADQGFLSHAINFSLKMFR